jgi:hypothetical protein
MGTEDKLKAEGGLLYLCLRIKGLYSQLVSAPKANQLHQRKTMQFMKNDTG